MAGTLPASGPISASQMADVWDEASTNISIRGLATSASLSAGEVAFSDFYGTGPSSCTAFAANAFNTPKVPVLCATTSFPVTRYHNGFGATPTTGDKVFTNPSCTTPLADGTYPAQTAGGAVFGMELESGDGTLDGIILCP